VEKARSALKSDAPLIQMPTRSLLFALLAVNCRSMAGPEEALANTNCRSGFGIGDDVAGFQLTGALLQQEIQVRETTYTYHAYISNMDGEEWDQLAVERASF
jgi:hypothetical protein